MNILDELKSKPSTVTNLMDAATAALRKARRWPVAFTWRGHECRASQTVFRALAGGTDEAPASPFPAPTAHAIH